MSTLSAEVMRYLIWGGVIAIGALFAVLDRRWIRRPLFAVLSGGGCHRWPDHHKGQSFHFCRWRSLHGRRDPLRRVGTRSGRLRFGRRLALYENALASRETIMKCISRTAGSVALLLTSGLALLVANRPAIASSLKTITCPYLQAEDLRFDIPANLGDLPTIDFDYPAKVTIFSFRDGHLLLVAMDEGEPSRLRIVISAQLNKARGTYDGQFVVDMGGNQLQLDSGPVSCRVGRRQQQK